MKKTEFVKEWIGYMAAMGDMKAILEAQLVSPVPANKILDAIEGLYDKARMRWGDRP